MRNGADDLKVAALHQSVFVRNGFDLMLLFASVVIMMFLGCYSCLRCLTCRRKKAKKE